MNTTKTLSLKTPLRTAPAKPVGPVVEAQGYTIHVAAKMEAALGAPDGSSSIVTAAIELVRPSDAAELLATQVANRRISVRRVETYARMIRDGRWRPSSQGVAIDADGRLIDGQHRLTAVVAANTPVLMMIVRGLPAATQNVLDAGRSRKAGDQYNIANGSTDGAARVSVARVIALLRNGWDDATRQLGIEESFALVDQYGQEIDWVMESFPGGRRLTPAPVAGAWAFAYSMNPGVAEYVEAYRLGAGLSRGDPLLALRDLVTGATHYGSSGRFDLALKTCRALSLRLVGKTAHKLYASREGVLVLARMGGLDLSEEWAWHITRDGKADE